MKHSNVSRNDYNAHISFATMMSLIGCLVSSLNSNKLYVMLVANSDTIMMLSFVADICVIVSMVVVLSAGELQYDAKFVHLKWHTVNGVSEVLPDAIHI